jgi:hypothetical protein
MAAQVVDVLSHLPGTTPNKLWLDISLRLLLLLVGQ